MFIEDNRKMISQKTIFLPLIVTALGKSKYAFPPYVTTLGKINAV
jgi:hypothetical protein